MAGETALAAILDEPLLGIARPKPFETPTAGCGKPLGIPFHDPDQLAALLDQGVSRLLILPKIEDEDRTVFIPAALESLERLGMGVDMVDPSRRGGGPA